ncbi:FUSC family protein [Hyunsoonleella flava]|uniref:FUSC family protein n=1 Tax=Hyunsoonleella flava TaxID=2527939 RepID=A0A4Q9FDV4_9FLAO|nr:FUSC family protein [Hyunsoonleella flava]TBN02996.1 FUSC family protein [Hyunsoonleella flava]
MKRLFTILAVTASVLTIVLSVLPASNLAIFPGGAALIFGLIAFYLSKKAGHVKKIIQFSFLLTIMALGLTTYKAIFNTTEVGDTETLVEKEAESKEEAIEELEDLDLDDIDIE